MTVSQPVFKIVTTRQRKSGEPRDAVQNVWYYEAPAAQPPGADLGNWVNTYISWMTAWHTTYGHPCMGVAVDDLTVEFTKVPPERVPAWGPPYDTLIGQAPPTSTGTGLPAEGAVALSLEGNLDGVAEIGPGGIRPANRRRSRKFLGPLADAAKAVVASILETIVAPTFANLLLSSFKTHMIDAQLGLGWRLTQFSKTDWVTYNPFRMWVDDAFDSQRRRGNDPTAHTTTPTAAGSLFVAQPSPFHVVEFLDLWQPVESAQLELRARG